MLPLYIMVLFVARVFKFWMIESASNFQTAYWGKKSKMNPKYVVSFLVLGSFLLWTQIKRFGCLTRVIRIWPGSRWSVSRPSMNKKHSVECLHLFPHSQQLAHGKIQMLPVDLAQLDFNLFRLSIAILHVKKISLLLERNYFHHIQFYHFVWIESHSC